MRNMKMALAVLAVLAMAGTTFGEVTISAELVGNPMGNTDYETWVVHTTGSAAFTDLCIEGNVVQVNPVSMFGGVTATPYANSMPDPYPEDWRAYDTHFMFDAPPDGALVFQGVVTEGNDKSLDDVIPYPGADSYHGGLGGFCSDMEFTVLDPDAVPVGLDLLQVVIPAGRLVYLTGNAVDAETVTTVALPSTMIGVPEPGTIALLIAGALCLVVARFRR